MAGILSFFGRAAGYTGLVTGAEGGAATPVDAANPLPVCASIAPSASRISYAAAAGGIVNSNVAVAFFAAPGATLRNHLDSFDIMWEALGTATELAIRDGAGGTVKWRMKIPAGIAGMREVQLPAPIQGSLNNLLEVVTLTASGTGAVFFNAQGHTGV